MVQTAQRRFFAWAAPAALCFAVVAFVPAGAQAATAPKHLSKQAKAKERRALARAVERNPATLLKRGFIRKAQILDFELPAVVRLNGPGATSDDVVDVRYDTSVFPWPEIDPTAGTAESQPSADQQTTLNGSFGMQLNFGGTSDGYGVLGGVETTQGQFAAMTATGFDVSAFGPTCSTSDDPCTGSATACPPGDQPELAAGPITLTSAGMDSGLLELFAGRFRGTLRLRADFAGERRSACAAPGVTTLALDDPAPLPVSVDGDFKISPAITADGRLRLGKISATNTAIQRSNFALLHGCTSDTSCDEQIFPLRLKVRRLTAELILGGQ